jgi:hypothetical protein
MRVYSKPNSGNIFGIYLEEVKKLRKVWLESQLPGGDMNLGPYEYETSVLITLPRRYCRPTSQHL